MSVEAMAWAFKQNCGGDASLKLVLVALCDHAGDDGLCWPSQERLATKAECSVRNVQRKLETLESEGFVECRRRARKTTIYRILLNKKAMRRQAVVSSGDDATNLRDDTTKRVDDTTIGVVQTINPNHQIEPPIESKPSGLDSISGGLFKNEELPKRQPKRSQRKMMPENWQPDETGIIYARERGFVEARIGQLVVACRDYHLKHGTLIAGSVGLAATWRTWINNEIKFTQERRSRYAHRNEATDLDDRIRNLVDEARRLEDAAGVVRPSDAFRSH